MIKLNLLIYFIVNICLSFACFSPLYAETNESLSLLNQSLQWIRALDNPQLKSQMLINLAQKYYQQKELDKFQELLNESWQTSDKIKEKSEQILQKINIINLSIKYEEKTSALRRLSTLKSDLEKLTDYNLKTIFLIDIAEKYEELGEKKEAQIIKEKIEITMIKASQPKPPPPPQFPFQEQPFKGKIRLGNNNFMADKNVFNINFSGALRKKWPRNTLGIKFKLMNNYDSSRRIDRQNRFVIDAVSEYKYYWAEKLYSFANFGYLQDDFSSVENRVSFFTGVGFNVWTGNKNYQKLDMQIGIGDLFQNSTIKNKEAPFPVIQYSLNYQDILLTDWQFNQQLILEIPVSNTANYYIDTVSKINIPTFEKWSLFGTINLKYIGITELNKPNVESRFIFGIEYEL